MGKIDARDWIFEVQTGPAAWAEIGGINTWELDPNANSESTEDTTFRSKGEYEGHAMQRGGSINLEGFWETDDDDPTLRDVGQATVDELATKKGRASLGSIRFRHEAQTDWTVWPRAYVEPGGIGGGNNDNTSWSADIIRSGAATVAPVEPAP